MNKNLLKKKVLNALQGKFQLSEMYEVYTALQFVLDTDETCGELTISSYANRALHITYALEKARELYNDMEEVKTKEVKSIKDFINAVKANDGTDIKMSCAERQWHISAEVGATTVEVVDPGFTVACHALVEKLAERKAVQNAE